MSLFVELKRRNVFKVGVAYAITAWIVLQLIDVVGDILALPEWVPKLILLLLAIGLIPALIFAWAFEMTPEGVKREKDVDRSQSITNVTSQKLNSVIIGVLVVALTYFAIDKFVLTPGSAQPGSDPFSQQAGESTTTVGEKRALTPVEAIAQTTIDAAPTINKQSIAVLPFVNMSSDPEQEYFSDGITEEIINSLVKIPGLSVPARTSVFGFKGHQGDVREIGQQLNVAYILEGSIRSQAKQVRITAQLIKVDDGFHLWSETFDRQLDNIFVVQEEIAGAIAEVLVGELGAGVETVPNKTVNMDAYDAYLNGRTLLRERRKGMIEALELATQLDPDFVPAWAALALAYQVRGYWTASGLNFQLKARETARHALNMDPKNVDAMNALASAERALWNWKEAEKHFDAAMVIDPQSTELLEDYAEFLCATGSTEKCTAVAARGYALDPDHMALKGVYEFALILTGRAEEALAIRHGENTVRRGQSWVEDDLQVHSDLDLDAFLSAGDTNSAIQQLEQLKPVTAEVAASIKLLKDPSNTEAMEVLKSVGANAHPNAFWFSTALEGLIPAYLGEAEYVIDMILEIDSKAKWGSTEYLWDSAWNQVRTHPRFVEVLELYKLPEYWDHAGWPEFCQRVDGGITCR